MLIIMSFSFNILSLFLHRCYSAVYFHSNFLDRFMHVHVCMCRLFLGFAQAGCVYHSLQLECVDFVPQKKYRWLFCKPQVKYPSLTPSPDCLQPLHVPSSLPPCLFFSPFIFPPIHLPFSSPKLLPLYLTLGYWRIL